MARGASRTLEDLFAATKAVSHDDGCFVRGADGRQQHALPDLLRDSELLPFVSEGACHATASRSRIMAARSKDAVRALARSPHAAILVLRRGRSRDKSSW